MPVIDESGKPINLIPFEDAKEFADWCADNSDGPLSIGIKCCDCGKYHAVTFDTAEKLGNFITEFVVIPAIRSRTISDLMDAKALLEKVTARANAARDARLAAVVAHLGVGDSEKPKQHTAQCENACRGQWRCDCSCHDADRAASPRWVN